MFISLTLISAAIGSIFGGVFADRLGRKAAVIISDILLIFGPGILWYSTTLKYLLLGRVLTGLGIGVSILSSTLFLSESAPTVVRGAVVASYQVMIAVGTLVAFSFALLSIF